MEEQKLYKWSRSRSSQRHDLYKLCGAPVTDASHQVSKSLAFWLWRRFLKVFSIYSHGSHLGHVTLTIYKLSFPLPKDAPYEVWLRLAKRFQMRRCFIIMDIYMYIAPGQAGADNPPGAKNFPLTLFFCPFAYSQ